MSCDIFLMMNEAREGTTGDELLGRKYLIYQPGTMDFLATI